MFVIVDDAPVLNPNDEENRSACGGPSSSRGTDVGYLAFDHGGKT